MVRSGALSVGLGLLALAGTARADEKEPPVGGDGAVGLFLRAAHPHVHAAWVGTFLRNAGERLPATDPINDRSRRVVVLVSLVPDGTLVEAKIERGSGSRAFDLAALDVFPSVPFPQLPEEAVSDDGHAYLRWAFARDQRQCSEASFVQKEGPFDEALPRLLAHRRDREAIRRVKVAAAAAPEAALGRFARAWLERALDQTVQSLPAAIGLAGVGDARGVEVLRAALASRQRAAQVTAALLRLKVPIPPEQAVAPRRPATESLSTDALIRLLRKGEVSARVEAATTLAGRWSDGAARQALATLNRQGQSELKLFGAAGESPADRAALIVAVGTDGRDAYRALVRGPARGVAGEWLLSQFDKLTAPVQVEVLSEWLWGSEASPVTLSAR